MYYVTGTVLGALPKLPQSSQEDIAIPIEKGGNLSPEIFKNLLRVIEPNTEARCLL